MMKLYLLLLAGLLMSGAVSAADDPIVTQKVQGKFHEVAHNIRAAILGKGIHIAHVLPASGMLSRTGSAFGYEKPVYANAELYEFCSASISHKLARQNPDNIVLCPFTIGVYTLTDEPGMVRITYRIPTGKPGSDEVVKEVVDLISGIIEDASW
jgi:uncharacterized protein (DUF302 family)